MQDVREKLSTVEAFELDEINRAFRAVMATNEGKRVIFWMLDQCGINQTPFTGDDNLTNYMLGQQKAGRKLIDKLDELNPRFYPKLLLDVADMKDVARATVNVATQGREDDDYAP